MDCHSERNTMKRRIYFMTQLSLSVGDKKYIFLNSVILFFWLTNIFIANKIAIFIRKSMTTIMMKRLFVISLFLAAAMVLQAQESKKMTKKEKKAAKKAALIEKTKVLIESEAWQFDALQMLPSQGESKALTTSYSVVIKDKEVDSYLPYFGRAYSASYGSTESPMIFKSEITDYKIEEWKKGGWIIKFIAKNKNDLLNFTFTIAETGSTTLSVNSTNRQNISYHGDIVEIEKKEK